MNVKYPTCQLHPSDSILREQSYFVKIPNYLAVSRLKNRQEGEFLVCKDTSDGHKFFLYVNIGRKQVKMLRIGPGPDQYVINYRLGEDIRRRPRCEIFNDVVKLIRYYLETEFNVGCPKEPLKLVQLSLDSVVEHQSFFIRTIQGIRDIKPNMCKRWFKMGRPFPEKTGIAYYMYVGTEQEETRQVSIFRSNTHSQKYWLGSAEEMAKFQEGQVAPKSFDFVMDLLKYYHTHEFTIDNPPGMRKEKIKLWSPALSSNPVPPCERPTLKESVHAFCFPSW